MAGASAGERPSSDPPAPGPTPGVDPPAGGSPDFARLPLPVISGGPLRIVSVGKGSIPCPARHSPSQAPCVARRLDRAPEAPLHPPPIVSQPGGHDECRGG